MELNYGHLTAFLFVALPLIFGAVLIGIFFYKAYQYQKELKAQSDALFKKLENH